MEKNPYEVSQETVMLNVLYKGGSFTELELGEMISGKRQRGARSFIAVARKNGHQIASKKVINPETNRLNYSYYIEPNGTKWTKWVIQNGFYNFKVGAPTY